MMLEKSPQIPEYVERYYITFSQGESTLAVCVVRSRYLGHGMHAIYLDIFPFSIALLITVKFGITNSASSKVLTA
ncbi:hypothetical protein BDV37DRAFT_246965 [Aspergillus pseudonomiae]|uniref:Uncharacterized protein n=1 Tax=Aspergillus pseudonomiae TaxID=1506151 RepID=A0A5N7DGK9_9EURO|nr:uncharacterized protein BDV37DRAFT_246965 [Aspergillus pseudonomiae]KAE8404788.1 hypothetical protein BDV37DRAFT_246965 [Aspergillus pseudonomiae]